MCEVNTKEGVAKNLRKIFKIILLGIISKVCLAETLSNQGRHVNYDEEIASLPLSVKLVLGFCCSRRIQWAIEDRSSPPLVGSRRGKWQSE